VGLGYRITAMRLIIDHFRIRRRDRAGGVIHEYRLVA
jgi:hypothetical protein